MATFTARKRKSHIKYEGASFERYPHRLLLYKDPPIEEISLETFEQFAIDRLKCEYGKISIYSTNGRKVKHFGT